MSRKKRILRNIALALVGLVVVLGLAGIVVVQSDWFRDYVKRQITASTQTSTGGTAEIGSFQLDWKHLRAVATDFVIHGSEPRGAAPFLRAARVQLDIRLLPNLHHLFDIAYLGIASPQANIMVFPDGRTNVPSPKPSETSGPTAPETVMDLAVGHFDLSNGLLVFESRKQALDVRGSNLHAQLWFNALQARYSGDLSFQPLYVASGRNTPVNFTVRLPMTLRRDRIDVQNATITTASTSMLLNGSVEDMRDPKISAHINGHVALADLKNVVDLPIALDAGGVPAALDLDANATLADGGIQVAGLRLGIGQSNLEASGALKDPRGHGSLEFKSRLALGELGRLAKRGERPEGTVVVNGAAKLDADNNYDVGGNLQARNISFVEGTERVKDVDLISAFHLDPHNLDLKGLRLSALGGEFAGDVSLQDFARYQVRGGLRNLNVRMIASAMGEKQFAYDGTLSGPVDAKGDLKSTPITRSLAAHAKLSIAPGRQGVPISGRLAVDYSGASDNLRVDKSYIVLPHTRLDLDGSVGQQLNISVTTTDLEDLLAAAGMNGKSSVNLNHRQATFVGTVTGKMQSPRLAGHLKAAGFSVEGRQFDSLVADASAASSGASVRNAVLTRGAMQTEFSLDVGLKNWSATPEQRVSADATVRNGDLADLIVLAGQNGADYSGAVSATMHIGGTIGNPSGAANIQVTNGVIFGEPFDRAQGQVNLADQTVTVPTAFIQSGASRVSLSAGYEHPRDNFMSGRLRVHVESSGVDLAQVRNLQKQRPNTSGAVQVNAEITATVTDGKEFLLTGVSGDASARGLRIETESYGDINANTRTSGQTVTYQLTSNFAGSNIQVAGNTELVRDYPTTADATIRNLPVERVLAVANRKDIPASGKLSGTAHFSGTQQNPQASVDIDLADAALYDEPLDRVHLQAAYQVNAVEVLQLAIASGQARIEASGRFDHPPGKLDAGSLQFHVNSSNIDLARIHNLKTRRPGLGGKLQLTANGKAEIKDADPRLIIQDLSANIAATEISMHGKDYGELKLTANSESGKVNLVLASNLGGSSIEGRGSAQIAGHYPIDAQLTFSNVVWTHLRGLIAPESAEPASFDLTTDGQASIHGPLLDAGEVRGSAQLSKFQLTSIPAARGRKPVMLQNQGPLSASLDHQVVRIDSAHLTGPQTDVQAKGTLSLRDQSLNLTLNANANLALLQDFDRDISSSGSVVVDTTVRGTLNDPLVNGKIEIQKGSLNYASLPNGISEANGTIVFNGTSASVRNLSAESGGGKLTLTGFATLNADNPRFGLRANASGVRVRIEQGTSIVADANVNLSGTLERSQLSGTATITQIAYAPQTDLGSFLTRAAPPVQADTAPSFLDNMKLDVRVHTSDAMAVQTSLAESLQAQADLRIRGTASHPGALGRVNITEGTMTFFGSSYTVNSGSIGFFNPLRIEPVLDISLETQAQGVDVTVRVSGPADNLKLTYTSDPPLQFQEIISLLASGKTPTSDPNILANQPAQASQTFQQMGESALLGTAVADPISSRLQRVFGVSQLKIDPTFTSGSDLPQAQVTLQQRVSDNITFTYVTALDDPNSTIIQMQMTLNQQWSALATRDQNGIFSINLLYKRQIR